MIEDVVLSRQARVPVIWLETYEEERALAELGIEGKSEGWTIWVWSATSNNGNPGWEAPFGEHQPIPEEWDEGRSSDPALAVSDFIEYCTKEENITLRRLAVFKDVHQFLNPNNQHIGFIRSLRDASSILDASFGTIVCLSPTCNIPLDLEIDVDVVSPGLPKREDLETYINDYLEEMGSGFGKSLIEKEDIPKLIETCEGLTLSQVFAGLNKSCCKFQKIDIPFIRDIRVKAISSIPSLYFEDERIDISSVGGLDLAKKWLEERRQGFSQEAKDFGLPAPRNVLLIGVPGAGKSLLSKAVATYFNRPLARLNLSEIKGGLVGSTEQRFKRVKDMIRSTSLVLRIDEIEKALPKKGSVNNDGGASDVILSGTLDLLENTPGTFIIATSNDISALPPELLRKGRWDAIFFVDLPNNVEREEILKIHLAKRNRSLTQEEINLVVAATKNYSGAEIEAAVVSGMWKAFSAKRDIKAEDIILSTKEDPPLYQMMKEDIRALREWAKVRTRPASSPTHEIETKSSSSSPSRRLKPKKNLLEKMQKAEKGESNGD